jgi:hypothetical protein
MNSLPFDKPGKFWKGNLHTHTTRSDGALPVEEVCRRYAEAGYDFLAITEHFMAEYGFPITDTTAFRTDSFTTLYGAELHSGRTELGSIWHILAVGLPLDFAPPSADETGPQIAARALDAGAYVAIAHPHWYGLTEADAISLGRVHAVEIFNGVSVDDNDRAESWYMLDLLSSRGLRYTACATDDAHFLPGYQDFALGWVHVKAETLTPESILAALKAGHYYSSTGPQIHDIRVEPGRCIYVRCSPVESIFFAGKLARTVFKNSHGLTEVELPLDKFDSHYGRVTVRDAAGRRAWSNPIWFE